MIIEFKISNFSSFREEQVLSFEPSSDKDYESQYCIQVKENVKLLKLGIVYGANASGKTNLLKALNFLRNFIVTSKIDKTEPTGSTPFLFDQESVKQPSEFTLSFYLDKIKYIYNVIMNSELVTKEKLTYYPSKTPALFFERVYDNDLEKSIIKFGGTLHLKAADKNIIEGLTLPNSSVISAFARANVEKSPFSRVFTWFKSGVMPLITPQTDLFGLTSSKIEESESCKNFVLDILQKADFNISSIEIEEDEIDPNIDSNISNTDINNKLIKNNAPKQTEISFSHKTELVDKIIPVSLESNGTLRYYGLGGVLNELLSSGKFLSIDEIENSLHYDLVSHFLKTFLMNSNDSQLLFSTHDINLLNEEYLRRDTIWFVDKNSYGASELYSLLDFKLHKNISPFNAYRIGKLGAKPNLGGIILSDNGKN